MAESTAGALAAGSRRSVYMELLGRKVNVTEGQIAAWKAAETRDSAMEAEQLDTAKRAASLYGLAFGGFDRGAAAAGGAGAAGDQPGQDGGIDEAPEEDPAAAFHRRGSVGFGAPRHIFVDSDRLAKPLDGMVGGQAATRTYVGEDDYLTAQLRGGSKRSPVAGTAAGAASGTSAAAAAAPRTAQSMAVAEDLRSRYRGV